MLSFAITPLARSLWFDLTIDLDTKYAALLESAICAPEISPKHSGGHYPVLKKVSFVCACFLQSDGYQEDTEGTAVRTDIQNH